MRVWLLVTPHVPPLSAQVEGYMKAEAASDTLVALSRNHFSVVMYEMQHHLRPLDLTDEFVIVTLAKLANGNGRAPAPSTPFLAGPVPPPGLHASSHFSLFFSFSGMPSCHLHGSVSAVKIRSLRLCLAFWSLFLSSHLLQIPLLSPSEAPFLSVFLSPSLI